MIELCIKLLALASLLALLALLIQVIFIMIQLDEPQKRSRRELLQMVIPLAGPIWLFAEKFISLWGDDYGNNKESK